MTDPGAGLTGLMVKELAAAGCPTSPMSIRERPPEGRGPAGAGSTTGDHWALPYAIMIRMEVIATATGIIP